MCADEAKRRQSGCPQPKGEHCLSSLRFRAQLASPASGVQWTLPESCHQTWRAGTQFHDLRLPVLCTGTPRKPIPGACRPRRSLHVRVEHPVSGWKQRAGYRSDRYTLVARPACRCLSRAAARPTLGGRRLGSGIIERASARFLSRCLTRAVHSHLLFNYREFPVRTTNRKFGARFLRGAGTPVTNRSSLSGGPKMLCILGWRGGTVTRPSTKVTHRKQTTRHTQGRNVPVHGFAHFLTSFFALFLPPHRSFSPRNSPIRLVHPGTEQVPFEVTLTHFRTGAMAFSQTAMLLLNHAHRRGE